jgi:hypothetical protein
MHAYDIRLRWGLSSVRHTVSWQQCALVAKPYAPCDATIAILQLARFRMRLVRTIHLDAFFMHGWWVGINFFFLRDVSIKYVMHDILYRMQHLSLQERAAFSATVCLRRCGKIIMHILMRSRDGAWAQYITHSWIFYQTIQDAKARESSKTKRW